MNYTVWLAGDCKKPLVLVTKYQIVIRHTLYDRERTHIHPALPQLPATALKALFDDYTDALQHSTRLLDEVDETAGGAAICKKIVNDEHTVIGRQEFL